MSATRHLKNGTWCVSFDFLMLVARVGGRWYESSQCGWFDFAFLSLSSDAGDQIGARLLNLIRDLMCMLLRLYALRSCRRWLDSYH